MFASLIVSMAFSCNFFLSIISSEPLVILLIFGFNIVSTYILHAYLFYKYVTRFTKYQEEAGHLNLESHTI